jgi:hypothetical protein
MKTINTVPRKSRWSVNYFSAVLAVLAALGMAPLAYAQNGYVGTWNGLYPDSNSLANADQVANGDCRLCHAASTQNLNPYGAAICSSNAGGGISGRIQDVEGLNSDADPTGSDNITEIDASTQPGWTLGNVNPIYFRGNCQPTGNTEAAPTYIIGLLDPAGGNSVPVANNDTASTPVNTQVAIDVLANDTDADAGDTLTVNSFDNPSTNGGTINCSLSATTPTPQCTFTPATDVCGADTFTYDVTDGTDVSVNRATVTISVGDANAPLVTAPTPDPLVITLPAGTDPGTTVPASDPTIAAWLGSASATDPEEGAVAVNNNAPANFSVGTTPVTFTATDSCGNTGSAAASVTIQIADNNVPVVTAPTPDPLTVTAQLCATSVPQSAIADNFAGTIADWLGTASATDAEDGTLSVSNNAPADLPLGNTAVTFSATDGLEATGTATATVSVAETPNTAPVVTAPTPDPLVITLPPGSTGPVPATDPTIAAWLASATGTDAEDGTLTVSNDAPADFPIGTTVVTFTATDSCGLTTTASASVTIEVQGNTTPVVTAPAPLTVDAPLCATSIPAADEPIASWLASATANDAEDGALPVSNDAPADFPIGTTTVTFSATDILDATGTATSTATVNDTNTAPVVNAPAPLSLTVPVGTTSVPATDPAIAAFLASATANDAEDGPLAVSNDAPADFPLGTTTVTFSATDFCGVTTTAQSTVTIQEEVVVVVDLDIAQLKVTKRVRLNNVKPVSPELTVKNGGVVEDDAPATFIGVQNGVEVYNETLTVSDPVGNGRTKFTFPSYTPDDTGDITWTATIADGDPDDDTATATTTVQ